MSKTGYNYCADLVKRNDVDRYLSTLFAPRDKRPLLFALYAFAVEIAQTRFRVSEPMLGEIRYQWWREAVEGLFAGAPRRHEVINALAQTLQRQPLPQAPFGALIDAHARDLNETPLITPEDLLLYGQALSFPVMMLAALILTRGEKCADLEIAVCSAARAVSITQLLRSLPGHLARGQCIIPQEILAHHAAELETMGAGMWDTSCARALHELIGLARSEMQSARAELRQIPDDALPVFLPLRLCEVYLKLMSRPDFNPLRHTANVSLAGRQLRMIAAMLTRRL